jgi:hypothetical protein
MIVISNSNDNRSCLKQKFQPMCGEPVLGAHANISPPAQAVKSGSELGFRRFWRRT